MRCLHQSCTTNILGGGGGGKFGGGHPEPEKRGRGQSQKFFFSTLTASVLSKNKGRGGGGPRAPPPEPPLCLTCTTLQSVLSRTAPRVCRINVKLFHVPKRVMNGYSKG